ncbi:MAG: hypothetical protein ACLPYB_11025 [Desulfobaccales bacterium]
MLKARLSIFLIIFLLALIYIANAYANPLPHAPQIQSKQQAESRIKNENQPAYQKNDPPNPIIPKGPETANNQQTKSDSNTQKATDQGTEFCILYGYRFRISDLLLVAFTFALVLCTATLAVVSIWQGQFAKKTLTSTRRAFVFLKDIELMEIRGKGYSTYPSNDQTTWLFFPRWANSGDTPTRNLTVSIGCKVTSQGLPDNFDYSYIDKELSNDNGLPYVIPIQKDIRMMIGPKAEILGKPLKIATLEYVISTIIDGVMDIYIWGQAEYSDIFDGTPRHQTRFCVKLYFTPQRGQVGRQPPLVVPVYYGKYNCADEDCDEQS